jgi:hypothetical protein
MPSYKFPSQVVNTTKRQMRVGFGISIVLVIVIIAAVSIVAYRGEEVRLSSLIITWMLFIGAVGFGLFQSYRQLKKREQRIENLEFILEDASLTRRGGLMPDLTLQREHVGQITEFARGGLSVHAKDKNVAIFIPMNVMDYTQIRETLSSWAAIEPKQVDRSGSLTCFGFIAAALLYIGMFLIQLNWLVILQGIILIGIIAAIMIMVFRDPYLPNKQKIAVLVYPILLCPAILRLVSVTMSMVNP